MNLYEIVYLEGEFGRAITTTEKGNDADEAVEKAQEDYYFWKLIHCECIEENIG